uniref:F-box/FBD/LRR-repeat protein At1g13570-like n=1 Tax=Erigeron canadensis TaxID=72917 RepID=UPI001CB9D100|nr:F-box/FBD/LRR-repeat protein At1g13570-like [Erigeron canadensis]
METQGLSTDRISTLPQSLIENILCLVPIKDAVRTSVLAREWRSKWTTIPKLVFSEYSFDLSTKFNKVKLSQMKNTDPLYMERQRKMMSRKCKLFYALFQVLSVHQGPIHEFGLSTDGDDTYVEVDQIIGHLARNSALKKLTLDLATRPCYYKVLLSFFSFFSLHHLTELDLLAVILPYNQLPVHLGALQDCA